MGLLDRVINNAVNSMSHAAGNAIGNAVGNAVGDMAGAGINSVTTDIQVKNEQKMMALDEQKKVLDLPAKCPQCGAPTNKQLVCEYCHCKIVE